MSAGWLCRGEGDSPPSSNFNQRFYLGKYEVTQEQYEKVMGKNPSQFKGINLPVEMVSWNDAVEFCEELNKKERIPRGWEFSLPTEAQWEYACRAGQKRFILGAIKFSPTRKFSMRSGLKKTVEVGSYRPIHGAFMICMEM